MRFLQGLREGHFQTVYDKTVAEDEHLQEESVLWGSLTDTEQIDATTLERFLLPPEDDQSPTSGKLCLHHPI